MSLSSNTTSQPTPEIIRKFNELTQEVNRLATKIAELEFDRNEHRLVEETLKPLEGKRRAYRLVGEVLVERTVEEVLPSVSNNREKVSWKAVKRLTSHGRMIVYCAKRTVGQSYSTCYY